jgi:hypothetical protein
VDLDAAHELGGRAGAVEGHAPERVRLAVGARGREVDGGAVGARRGVEGERQVHGGGIGRELIALALAFAFTFAFSLTFAFAFSLTFAFARRAALAGGREGREREAEREASEPRRHRSCHESSRQRGGFE